MVGREVRVRLDECLAPDERRDVVAPDAGRVATGLQKRFRLGLVGVRSAGPLLRPAARRPVA